MRVRLSEGANMRPVLCISMLMSVGVTMKALARRARRRSESLIVVVADIVVLHVHVHVAVGEHPFAGVVGVLAHHPDGGVAVRAGRIPEGESRGRIRSPARRPVRLRDCGDERNEQGSDWYLSW